MFNLSGIILSMAKGTSDAVTLMRKEKIGVELGEFEISLRLNADVDPNSLKKPSRGRKTPPLNFKTIKSVPIRTITIQPLKPVKPGGTAPTRLPILPVLPETAVQEEINLEIRIVLVPTEPE